jgi:hypothetical protein
MAGEINVLVVVDSTLAEPSYIVEAASEKEIAAIDRRMKDYDKDRSSFVSLESVV